MSENQTVQLYEIIDALLVRTLEGRMEWVWDEQQAIGTATLENGRVIVSKDRDFDTRVRIQDVDSTNLEDINVGYTKYKDLKAPVDQLYELARRSALKIDSKLESIFREISS